MQDYQEFLEGKRIVAPTTGFETEDIHPVLFPFQRDLAKWALRKGRAAVFADTGLGKTLIQLAMAEAIVKYTGGQVLIIAPLAVCRQTVQIAQDLMGIHVQFKRKPEDLSAITITNYENVKHFDMSQFVCVMLDESSILKSESSKYRAMLIETCVDVPFRFCYTATPAPNDVAELANHAHFLGIMTRKEMLAAFFVHDQDGWRLKGHAGNEFYRWLASWGMSVKTPSDLGYSDDGYILPPLNITPEWVDVNENEVAADGQMIFTGLKGITHRSKIRRQTMEARVKACAQLINGGKDQWIVWVGLNDEGRMLHEQIPDSVLVEGTAVYVNGSKVKGAKDETRLDAIYDWIDGKRRVMITKVKILGFGMNFQHCNRMAYLGLNDSWEMLYQSIKRLHRFGQDKSVDVRIFLASVEDAIYKNVMSKWDNADDMAKKLIDNAQEYMRGEINMIGIGEDWVYKEAKESGDGWELWLGDSVKRMAEIEDNSIDLSVSSPPFSSLFTYTPTHLDIGNNRTDDEYLEHFGYVVKEWFRVTKPGRIAAVHIADVSATLVTDGYIGLRPISDRVTQLFLDHGWHFQARVAIDKNQQAQSIRTHSKGLTMTQFDKDRSWSRPALPDYILKFRKPGENAVAVNSNEMTRDDWIDWANPCWPADDWTNINNWEFQLDYLYANGHIAKEEYDRVLQCGSFPTWYGIRESDTLQGWQKARGKKDERHVCPLQLGTIVRCTILWSMPGETILDPFNGIGSTGVVALAHNRKYIGIELKEEYYNMALKNLRAAEANRSSMDLFSMAAASSQQMQATHGGWWTDPTKTGQRAYFEQMCNTHGVELDGSQYRTLEDAINAIKEMSNETS